VISVAQPNFVAKLETLLLYIQEILEAVFMLRLTLGYYPILSHNPSDPSPFPLITH
jgi:hypothetical protein